MNTTPVAYSFEKKGFLREWLLVYIVGNLIGGFTSMVLFYLSYEIFPKSLEPTYISSNPYILALIIGILAAFTFLGYGEQRILWRHTHLTTRWFLESINGTILSVVLCVLPSLFIPIISKIRGIDNSSYTLFMAPIAGLLFNLSIGLCQWRELREIIPQAKNWIVIKVLSLSGFLHVPVCIGLWGLGLLGFEHATEVEVLIYFLVLLFFILVIPGVIIGIITGLSMRNLLDKAAQKMETNQISK